MSIINVPNQNIKDMSQIKDESKVLTKNVQGKLNYNFKKLGSIIKSQGAHINPLASQLKEDIK